jgi:hypothetical protein
MGLFNIMTTLTPLNAQQHSQLKVANSTDYSRFSNEQLIPVVIQEMPALASQFPIVFVKNSETGQFLPVAIMGCKNGVNLYCQDKQWDSPVTPMGFANYPFKLAAKSEQEQEFMVCIELTSPLVNETNGQALFLDNGEKSEYLSQKSDALVDSAQMSQQTQKVSKMFADRRLFVSKQLTLKLAGDDIPVQLDGIFLIDEKALNALSSEDFEELRTMGLLPSIYAHLASLNQIARLVLKHNEQTTAAANKG